MAITDRSEDKYAFLFTGPTADPDVKDIENVFSVLTEFYNYPPNQVMVVRGSQTNPPNTPGATVTVVANPAQLEAALDGFAEWAKGPAAGSSDWKTAVLYFTGDGDASGVRIDDGDGNVVAPSWLRPRLEQITGCHVNVIMQQSKSGVFASALAGSSLTQWSLTCAVPNDERETFSDSSGDSQGSVFTDGWARACRLEVLPGGAQDAGKHADQLGGGAGLLVALAQAREFSWQYHTSTGRMTVEPTYEEHGDTQYLGKPRFEVHDGDPWWESPDVYLTHPNHEWVDSDPKYRDLYIPDGDPDPLNPESLPNNKVHVDVYNVGTHPVRSYGLRLQLCEVPGFHVIHERTDTALPAAVLCPKNYQTYDWDPLFDAIATTHACLRVQVRLFAGEVDDSWSETAIQARDFEAQRNADEVEVIPVQPDEPFPDLQGFMEHKYSLRNPFDEERGFVLVIPPIFGEYRDVLELSWFRALEGKRAEIEELEVVQRPAPHLAFSLAPKEVREIFLRVSMAPEFGAETEVRLPFEVLVSGDWRPEEVRDTPARGAFPGWAPLVGFTVVVRRGSSTLMGAIRDREGVPAAGARVYLRTVDGRQGAVTTTDREGRYRFAAINPNVYRVWSESPAWHSREQTAVLMKGRETEVALELSVAAPVIGQRLKVILDKIRIMNDHDPCLKGKGELTFTSVVEPDNDASRKQVKRLPSKDVFHVGDKPGKNEIRLGVTLFEGEVKNRALSFSISGQELDHFDRHDALNRYHRVFSGDPTTWAGDYSPTDEYLDREDVGDWALWYRIVPA